MDRAEYQQLRRQLDEELRAGIEMLQAGHRARVEALDARWREAEEERPAQPSAPPEEPAPPPEEPPAPEPPARRKDGALLADVRVALEHVGTEFVTRDVCLALGYEPNRSSLHRALWDLKMAGLIEIQAFGEGGRATRYRKAAKTAESC